MADNRNLMMLTCPECSQRMKIPSNAMGKTYKCVKCGSHVKVQAESIAPAEGAAGAGDFTLEPVGQLLLNSGLITQEQLNAALETQQRDGGKLIELLIRQDAMTKDQLHDFLSRQSGVATIDLQRFKVDRELVKMIPKEMALRDLVLPIDKLGKLLTVGMACPIDLVTIAAMEQHTGLRVKAVLCKYDAILDAVKKYYPDQEEDIFASLMNDMGKEPKVEVAERLISWELTGVEKPAADRLAQLCNDKGATPDAIMAAATADAALGIEVLRAANSAVFGMQGEVDNFPLALALLGTDGACAIARQAVNGSAANYGGALLVPLRTHAERTAKTAASLARAAGRVDVQVAFAAGFLHQLGRWALASISADKYARVDAGVTGAALAASERKLFSQDHLATGGTLASRWRLPNALHQVVRHYAQPEQAESDKELVHTVALASWLNAEDKTRNAPQEAAEAWARALGLKWAAVEAAGKV